ncbi:hypothetical protein D3C71_1999320 [compost metagenome]
MPGSTCLPIAWMSASRPRLDSSALVAVTFCCKMASALWYCCNSSSNILISLPTVVISTTKAIERD